MIYISIVICFQVISFRFCSVVTVDGLEPAKPNSADNFNAYFLLFKQISEPDLAIWILKPYQCSQILYRNVDCKYFLGSLIRASLLLVITMSST